MAHNDAVFLKEFGAWLVVLRKRLQMTQAELAKFLGVRSEAISRWEGAQQAPSAMTVMRLFALCTDQEREAIIERAMSGVKDVIHDQQRDNLSEVACSACGCLLRVRQFARAGWPAPKVVRQNTDPYKATRCPRCATKR